MIKNIRSTLLFCCYTLFALNASSNDDRLVWLDLEMTNLSPQTGAITEVAAIITDGQLNILSECVHLAIHHPPEILEQASPWVKKNLAITLHNSAHSNITPDIAENILIGFVLKHTNATGEPESWHKKPRLAGACIGTDKKFIEYYWPALHQLLHYNVVDVTTIRYFVHQFYQNRSSELIAVQNNILQGTHNAQQDVRESIKEMKYYKDVFFCKVLPPNLFAAYQDSQKID